MQIAVDGPADPEQEHFGEHITVDAYGGDPAKLDDPEVLRASLIGLCELLGMHPLVQAQVVSAPDNYLKDPGGWSGFLILSESHISIHTFPRRRFLSADAYSCRNGLCTEAVVTFFREQFDLEEFETNFIRRGVRYPAVNLV